MQCTFPAEENLETQDTRQLTTQLEQGMYKVS